MEEIEQDSFVLGLGKSARKKLKSRMIKEEQMQVKTIDSTFVELDAEAIGKLRSDIHGKVLTLA